MAADGQGIRRRSASGAAGRIEIAKKFFPREQWNPLHLRIIYYGGAHCTALGCDGTVGEIRRTVSPERKRPVKTRK